MYPRILILRTQKIVKLFLIWCALSDLARELIGRVFFKPLDFCLPFALIYVHSVIFRVILSIEK
jgi:hypothetical protein